MTRKRDKDCEKSRSTDNKWRTRWVRSRIIRHMRELIVAGAASGAALQFGCGPMDPSPTPFVCPTGDGLSLVHSQVGFLARWVHDGENWLVSVSIGVRAPHGGPLVFSGDPQLTDATPLEVRVAPSSIHVDCQPADDATSVGVSVPVDCNNRPYLLEFIIDVTGPPLFDELIPYERVLD